MKTRSEWRRCHALRLVTCRGWRLGSDPRRPGASCLISPRGTIYEFDGRHMMARPYRQQQIKEELFL